MELQRPDFFIGNEPPLRVWRRHVPLYTEGILLRDKEEDR